jgi:hypothetical protein
MKKHEIFVGITNDNELYFLEIENPGSPLHSFTEHDYFSMSGSTYRLVEETRGEEKARERLEDGELWKQAVEGDNTTQSLEDWVELVLDTDGWESMFDFNYDYSPVEYKEQNYYFDFSACGQHEVPIADIKYFAIPQPAYAELLRIWKEHHLKKETPQLPAIVQNVDEELQKAFTYLDEQGEL